MFKHEKLNLLIFIALIVLQLLGVIGLLTRFHLSYLPIMLPLFFWGGMSTTLYLHRYLTHRGFEIPVRGASLDMEDPGGHAGSGDPARYERLRLGDQARSKGHRLAPTPRASAE